MSIPSTINSIEEHIENAYDALALGGEDLTNVDKNLTNINLGLKNRYEDFLANGTDVIWNNWENKTTQEGASLHFDNTIQAKMQINLKGNSNQNGTPTPDNPVDIEVVTGDVTVNVTGKNLFDGITENIVINATGTIRNGFLFKGAGTFTLSADYYGSKYASYKIKTDDTYSTYSTLTLPFTFTLASNQSLIVYLGGEGDEYKNNYRNTQIEVGSTATSYEPYKGQSQLLGLGNLELCKIENYQDYIWYDENSDKWYKHKFIEKKNMKNIPTNNFYINNTNTENKPRWGSQYFSDILTESIQLYSNLLFSTTNTNTYKCIQGISKSNSQKIIYMYIENVYTYENLRTFLNNMILYYILETPIEEEITDATLISQLNALKQAKSYNNQTNITQTNDNLPFIINATALLKNA